MISIGLVFSILLCLNVYTCDEEPLESTQGAIYVLALDNDSAKAPVPDIVITITPGDIIKKTDTYGVCSFDLDPGEYSLDTEVCCAGASMWHPYHEQVTVLKGDTTEVRLPFCLSCE